MPKLNAISAKRLIKLITRLGFVEIRRRGSHCFFHNPVSKLVTTVPVHKNEDIKIGTLRAIIRDINLSVEDYEKLRKSL